MKKKGKDDLDLRLQLLFCLTIVLIIANGSKRLEVYLNDFAVTDNMKTIELDVDEANRFGHIRTLKAKQEEDSLYITFYSTYVDNALNANKMFSINVESDCDKIYFYRRGKEKWELVLQKDNTGAWERVE